jgi:hypothetical protein
MIDGNNTLMIILWVLLTGAPGALVKEPKRSNFTLKSIVFLLLKN